MNDARYRASSAVLPNGNVLIAGGTGPGHPGAAPALSSTELYDSKSNSFAAGPVMNQARTGATATLRENEKVLIAGGIGPTENSNAPASVEVYNPVTNSFAPASSTPTMNSGRTNASHAASSGDAAGSFASCRCGAAKIGGTPRIRWGHKDTTMLQNFTVSGGPAKSLSDRSIRSRTPSGSHLTVGRSLSSDPYRRADDNKCCSPAWERDRSNGEFLLRLQICGPAWHDVGMASLKSVQRGQLNWRSLSTSPRPRSRIDDRSIRCDDPPSPWLQTAGRRRVRGSEPPCGGSHAVSGLPVRLSCTPLTRPCESSRSAFHYCETAMG